MRLRHRVALVGTGALFLIATGYATVTRQGAVEARLESLLASALRAPCTFESAQFGFLEGLTVHGLRILDPEDPLRPPLIQVGEARIDFHLDVLGAGPRLTMVHLRRPTVRVTADREGRPSLLAIAASADPSAPAVEPPVLRIVDGRVDLEGPPALAPGTSATLTGIRADVLLADGRIRVPDGHARAEALGSVAFTLDADRDDGSVAVTMNAPSIDLKTFVEHSVLTSVADRLAPLDVAGSAAFTASLRLTAGVLSDVEAGIELTDAGVTVALPDRADRAPPEPLRVTLDAARIRLREGRVAVEAARGRLLGAALEIAGRARIGGLLGLGGASDDELDVNVTIHDAEVGPAVQHHFPRNLRRIRDAFDLAGRTDAALHVHGPLERPTVDAVLDIRGVAASYAGYLDEATGERRGFPWRAEQLAGRVTVNGRRVSFRADGRHGPARVAVDGFHESTSAGEPRTEVRIDVRDLPLDDDLRAAFGDRADQVLSPWQPEGVAARVEVLVEEEPEVARGEVGTHVTIHLDGRAAFVPHILPARLASARGTLRILEPELDGARISRVELEEVSATGAGFEVRGVSGYVQGADEDVAAVLAVERLDGPFRDAVMGSSTLTAGVKRSVSLLAPRGRADFDVRSRSRSGTRDDVVVARLSGVDVRGWEDVPLAVHALHGDLRYAADAISTEGLTGEVLGGAAVHVRGSLDAVSAATPRPQLVITATGVPLDTRLRDALGTLAEPARAVWDELPGERDLRADASVLVRPPGAPEGQLAFTLRNLRGGIRVLGLPLDLRSGEVAYEGASGVVSGALRAGRGGGELDVTSLVYGTSSGDVAVTLSARGLAFPGDLVPLLDEAAASTVADTLASTRLHVPALTLGWTAAERRLRLAGSAALRVTSAGLAEDGLHVRSAIELDDVVVRLPEAGPARVRGTARLSETSLDPGLALTELEGPVTFEGTLGGAPSTFAVDMSGGRARIIDLLLRDLSLRLEIEGETLRLQPITAELYGGRLEGRFNQGGGRLAYRGAFSLRDVDLALYADDRQRDAMAGRLDADVRFRDPGGPDASLEGTGEATLTGAEVRIPWISASLRAVDDALLGVAAIEGDFHEGELRFDLRGQRLLVRELHFVGPSVPLLFGATLELQDGRGAIDLVDGRLDLVVYPRLTFGVLGLDPTGLFDRILGVAQFMVRRLRIEGSTRNPRTRWELLSGDLEDEFARRPRPLGEVRRYGPAPW